MDYRVEVNMSIENHEVPNLRERIGWGRRDYEYPHVFERCNFWAGVRNEENKLIAFGYVTGMGLEHGYMEDIMVHPDYQKQGIGAALVKELLQESDRFGLDIVTVTYEAENANFYETSGFRPSVGGIWFRDE